MRVWVLAIPIVLSVAVLSATPRAAADEIALVADEWFPYNGQPDSAREGYMVDLARRIAAEHGHRVRYRLMDWEAALEAVRLGHADCVLAGTERDARGLRLTREPFGRSVNALFTRPDSAWTYAQPRDLRTLRLGAIAGYSYGKAIDDYIAQAPSERVTLVRGDRRAQRRLVSMLLALDIDAVVEDEEVMRAALDQLGQQGRLRVAGRSADFLDLYIACTPDQPRTARWVEQLDQGLTQLRDSGELARLLARYGLSDWLLAH
jgi:polar amino acid transport system substrate-binding protein